MKAMLHREKIILVLLLGLVACGTDDERTLTRDDAGTADSGITDLSMADDGSSEPDMGTEDVDLPDADPTVCLPNDDGTITRVEVPVQAGLRATFKIATDATFNTAGELVDGGTVWDLSGDLENDGLQIVELKDPAGQWFETIFPTATYYSKLAADSDLLGVFEGSDSALSLVGVASPDDGFTKTELKYAPVVDVLRFPISEDSTWTTESSVNGTLNGVISFYSEDYTTVAAGSGVLKTPYGSFTVLRLRTDLTRTVGVFTTKIRTYTFVAECFGTVATIRSTDNETDVEFTTAAEIRRLAP